MYLPRAHSPHCRRRSRTSCKGAAKRACRGCSPSRIRRPMCFRAIRRSRRRGQGTRCRSGAAESPRPRCGLPRHCPHRHRRPGRSLERHFLHRHRPPERRCRFAVLAGDYREERRTRRPRITHRPVARRPRFQRSADIRQRAIRVLDHHVEVRGAFGRHGRVPPCGFLRGTSVARGVPGPAVAPRRQPLASRRPPTRDRREHPRAAEHRDSHACAHGPRNRAHFISPGCFIAAAHRLTCAPKVACDVCATSRVVCVNRP
jgi:hypothetical protein